MLVTEYIAKYGEIRFVKDDNRGISFYCNGKNKIGGFINLKKFKENNNSFF